MSGRSSALAGAPRDERPRAWPPTAPAGVAVRVGELAAAGQRALATAAIELRLNLFSPAPWVVALALGALGYLAVRTAPEPSSFALAWTLSYDLGPLSGLLALFLAAGMAHRPRRYETLELEESKAAGSEELLLGRWAAMSLAIAVPFLVQVVATGTAQAVHSRLAVEPGAYLAALLRLAPPVLFLATISFILVTFTRILVLGSGLAALVWFILYFGRQYYPTALRPELSQNLPAVVLSTAGLLCLALAAHGGRRRAKGAPATRVLAWGSGALLAVAGTGAAWTHLALPSSATARLSWKRLAAYPRESGLPLPSFAWQDQHGRRLSLGGQRGAPTLLLVFQPKDQGLPATLRRLATLPRRFQADHLGVIAVCLSQDLGAGASTLRHAGAGPWHAIRVGTDWGELGQGSFSTENPSSVFGRVVGITRTPAALLLGPDGRELARDLPLDAAAWEDLTERLSELLGADGDAAHNPGQLAGEGKEGAG